MADNDETLALRRRARRRLVGAVALVLALVIVPPLVMDLEPKPVVTSLTVEIPQQGLVGLKPPASAPISVPPKPAVAEPSEAPQPAEPTPPPQPKREATKAAPRVEGAPAPSSSVDAAQMEAEGKRAEAILNADAYVVPVGSFASKENAKQLEAKLAQAGVKHYTENVATSSGEQ